MTAVKIPEGIDGASIPKIMRDKFGITIAGGQAHLKGKIFRIATLGYYNEFDVMVGMSALELTLLELGWEFELGSGVTAALEVLSNKKS